MILSSQPHLRFFNPYRHFVGSFIPNWLQRRRGISPGAKLCYARLAQYAGKKTGIAWPARKTLAKELGVGESQVDRYIIKLERHGLLHVTRRGNNQTNLYRFIQVEDFTESAQMRTRTPHIRGVQESAEVATKESQGRESLKRPTPPAGRLKSDGERKHMDPSVKVIVDHLVRSDTARFLPRIVQWVKAKECQGFDPPDIAGRLRELKEYEEKEGPTHDFWAWLDARDRSGHKTIANRRTKRLEGESKKHKNEGIGDAGAWLQAVGVKSI